MRQSDLDNAKEVLSHFAGAKSEVASNLYFAGAHKVTTCVSSKLINSLLGQYNKKHGFKRLALNVYVINVSTKSSLLTITGIQHILVF